MLRKQVIPKDFCIKGVKYHDLHNILKGALVQCNEWAFKVAGALDRAGFALTVWRELFLTVVENVNNAGSVFGEIVRLFSNWRSTLEENKTDPKNSATIVYARTLLMNAVASVLGTPKDRFRKLYINCGALYCSFRMDKDFIYEMFLNFSQELPEGFADSVKSDPIRRALQFIYLFCSGRRPNAILASPIESQPHEIRRLMAEIIPCIFLWDSVGPVIEIMTSFIDRVRNRPYFTNLIEIFTMCYTNDKKYGRERAILIAALEEFVRMPSMPNRSSTIKPTEEEISIYYEGNDLGQNQPIYATRSGNYELSLLCRYGTNESFQLPVEDRSLQYTVLQMIARVEAMIASKTRNRPCGRGVGGFLWVKRDEIDRMRNHVITMPSKMLMSSSGEEPQVIQYQSFDEGLYVFLDFEVDQYYLRSPQSHQFVDTIHEFDAFIGSSYALDNDNPSSGDVLCVGDPVIVKCGMTEDAAIAFHKRNLFKKVIDPNGQLLYRFRYSIHRSSINRNNNVFVIIKPPVAHEVPVRLDAIPVNFYQQEDRIMALIMARFALNQQGFPPNTITKYDTESDGSHFVAFDDFVISRTGPKTNDNAERAFRILRDEQRFIQILSHFINILQTSNLFPLQHKRLEDLFALPHFERVKILMIQL
jgi:hypothetical protein